MTPGTATPVFCLHRFFALSRVFLDPLTVFCVTSVAVVISPLCCCIAITHGMRTTYQDQTPTSTTVLSNKRHKTHPSSHSKHRVEARAPWELIATVAHKKGGTERKRGKWGCRQFIVLHVCRYATQCSLDWPSHISRRPYRLPYKVQSVKDPLPEMGPSGSQPDGQLVCLNAGRSPKL